MERKDYRDILGPIADARGLHPVTVYSRIAEWFAAQNSVVQALVLRQVDEKSAKPEALKVVYLGFRPNKAK